MSRILRAGPFRRNIAGDVCPLRKALVRWSESKILPLAHQSQRHLCVQHSRLGLDPPVTPYELCHTAISLQSTPALTPGTSPVGPELLRRWPCLSSQIAPCLESCIGCCEGSRRLNGIRIRLRKEIRAPEELSRRRVSCYCPLCLGRLDRPIPRTAASETTCLASP